MAKIISWRSRPDKRLSRGLSHALVLLSLVVCVAPSSIQPIYNRELEQQITSNMLRDMEDLKIRTPKPVIGVLTQVLRDYKRFSDEHQLHIAASYIKWVESSGAQALPILLNKDDSYYEQVFKQTNGLLFPGGDNLLDPAKRTPMMTAAKKLYSLAIKANDHGDYYPIWGTCLGLELLSVLTANRNVLEKCSAVDESLPMTFVARGKLFAPTSYANLPGVSADYAGVVVEALTNKNLTYNYHTKCLTDDRMKTAGLDSFYRPLAYSQDSNNVKFISIFEAISYPFFGVQFHPEKPPFEFVVKPHQIHVPHSRQAIAVSRYFGDFFVQQAQLNSHRVHIDRVEDRLIYAYQPTYTAIMHDMYEQRYMFPFGNIQPGMLTEEFIEHIPTEDEIVPEEVSEDGRVGLETSSPKLKSDKLEVELINDFSIGDREIYLL